MLSQKVCFIGGGRKEAFRSAEGKKILSPTREPFFDRGQGLCSLGCRTGGGEREGRGSPIPILETEKKPNNL